MPVTTLREHQMQERQLRNTLLMVKQFATNYSKERDEAQIEVRLAMVEDTLTKFYAVRRKIEALTDSADLREPSVGEIEARLEAHLNTNTTIVWEFENLYCEAKAMLLSLKPKQQTVNPPVSDTAVCPSVPISRVKLPDIKLPTFSGNLMQWISFRDSFRSLIDNNHTLSAIDKFTYLRASVTGEAQQEIQSIELSEANYDVAWHALENRYENKKLILKSHLDALFSAESVRKESFEALNQLLSTFDKNLQMIEKLGIQTNNWSILIAYILTSKLDSVTLRNWETQSNSKEFVKYEAMTEFLRRQCSVLQSIAPAKSQHVERHQYKHVAVHSVSVEPNSCCFCNGSPHNIFQCPAIRKMNSADKIATVKRNLLCFNCLSPGHVVSKCSRGFCTICKRKHHTLLHDCFANAFRGNTATTRVSQMPPRPHQASTRTQPPQSKPQNQSQPLQSTQHSTRTLASSSNSQQTCPRTTTENTATCDQAVSMATNSMSSSRDVLLSTAIVKIRDHYGNTFLVRALLDSASQRNLMTRQIAQKLKCPSISEYLKVKGVGSSETTSTSAVVATILARSSLISEYVQPMKFHVLNKVTSKIPLSPMNQLEVPSEIILADPHFNVPGGVDLIIGAEYFYDLLCEGRRKLGESGPTLQNTTFGWIVSGVADGESAIVPRVVLVTEIDPQINIQELLARFWELESCHVKSTMSIEETECEKHFNDTTIRDKEGRFIVTLPKKESLMHKLGESRATALKRFLGVERRLNANDSLRQQYMEFIHEYRSMGHMVEIRELDVSQTYYMPHHAVIKPDSTTTKLRVVFDASCATSTGISLNNALMVGPVVQEDLLSIILRFRCHMIAVVADVAKMYRMVKVQASDQDLQRILWRDSPTDPIKCYKLTTVTYGTASAPYLATKCLQTLAEQGKESHPIGAKAVERDFYVDDLLSGADTIDQVCELVSQTSHLLESAGFVLRKWRSNKGEALINVPSHLRDDDSAKELDSSSAAVKTLGLLWDSISDDFRFNVPKWNSSAVITKRVVLSDAARIFDPLGLVSPVTILAKIFLQELWKGSLDWDIPLPEELEQYWVEFRRNMLSLESITVPRWIGICSTCVQLELHGFCDASEKAYGACIYLRSVWDDGAITVRLLTTKSKVAPLEDLKRKKKKLSIPRLELSAAVLLSHLYEKVKGSTLFDSNTIFWTDSMIVKCWLSSSPSRWQPFVAHRVSEIQHVTRGSIWNHVAGIENPADLVSRGMLPAQLSYSNLWWHGPLWLRQERNTWPHASLETQEDKLVACEEEKASIVCAMQAVSHSEIFSLRSSLLSLVRLVAVIRRFTNNAKRANRGNRKIGFITYAESEEALMVLVRLSQRECFATELAALSKGDQVARSSRLIGKNPQLVEGVIQLGGRLSNAAIPIGRKHPIILDDRHPLTALIVRHYHHKYYHAGQQLLISCVRERFWPLNIRRIARQIIHQCIPCFRSKPKVQDQLMADLPEERVNPAPPFLKVGLDYCGPFYMSYPGRKARPVKCFVAVFVCLVTKAVHLEAVADLTTQAFLAALRRFVARRSKPILIMCDNAKTFVGARRELDELAKLFGEQHFQEAVTKGANNESIEFKFIPARSPNFGGLWEAAVKSFKTHFKKTIGIRSLTYDEFVTVLVQIEACLNSRPLTPLSSDPNDLAVLTPGHFLVQRPITSIAEPTLDEIPENRLSMWQKTQNFVQMIWKKWSTQYLSDLHNRTKWTRQRDNLRIGTMVLLKEENLPPLRWLLGRVIQVHTGNDGNVRVAVVKTKDGIYERGISKICVLPIRDNQPSIEEES
ncbi:uncharacterized protein LOC128736793 [Sabethes cyaneus]|uniref:uncharacterized protein LOC128736793 n=1 Tax=Sabethes cyaneus TaxID=53552 RepID=UPI00237E63FE|nr:uncharacterized protein LOC128736793 [Sabethes cyaneus]